MDVAAANWVATALAVAGRTPTTRLLIDVGSTTTEAATPRASRRPAATTSSGWRRTRLHRGAPRHQPRGDRPARAGPRRVVPGRLGYFLVISGDVHLVLGRLDPEAYDCPTPDGRPPASTSRASASPGWCAPTSSSSNPARSTPSPVPRGRAAAPDRGHGAPGWECADARGAGRRGGFRRFPGREVRVPPRASRRPRAVGRGAGTGRGAGRAAGGTVLTVVKVGGGLCYDVFRACAPRSASSASATRCSSCPAGAGGSPTPCGGMAASGARAVRTGRRSSAWSSWAVRRAVAMPGCRAPCRPRVRRGRTGDRLLPAAPPLEALPASWT